MNESAIKRQENSYLGESRTRSFLASRFWILERSIDSQGADFLIQRRILSDNFLQKRTPRLGIIQTKYIQNADTNIYVRSSYVTQEDKLPYPGFFLLIHTGKEDNEKDFLFTSRQIIESFDQTKKDQIDYFYIPGKIINDNKNRIVSKKLSLDLIEHELEKSDFLANRYYYSSTWLPANTNSKIYPDYKFPINNPYGNLEILFNGYKLALSMVSSELDDTIDGINKIIQIDDPVKAHEIFEESIEEHLADRNHFSFFSRKDLWGEELYNASNYHMKKLTYLREKGLDSQYLDTYCLIKNHVYSLINDILPSDKNFCIIILIDDFISNNISKDSIFKLPKENLNEIEDGKYTIIDFSRWDNKSSTWDVFIQKNEDTIFTRVMNALEKHYIPNFEKDLHGD